MRVYASLSDHLPLADVPAYVQRVESLGYQGIHVAETVHDVFLTSLLAIQNSSSLTVRTSVAVAFPRSPMITAIAAWDLALLSGGRFSLGLGTQVKGNLEGRYATAWTEPVARMREYVASLRAIFHSFQTGQPLELSGESYSFRRLQPYFNPGAHDHPEIPIYLGGVNPRMCALAGEVADGLVTHPTSAIPEVLERIASDVRAGGRDIDIVASTQFVAGPDPASLASRREDKRRLLGFLYSTPAYRPALAAIGFGDRADELHALSRSGSWEDLTAVIDDDLLERIAPSVPYSELASLLLARYGERADALVVTPPEDPSEDQQFGEVLAALRRT
jgi:probable F420-dependent oxidoreductase